MQNPTNVGITPYKLQYEIYNTPVRSHHFNHGGQSKVSLERSPGVAGPKKNKYPIVVPFLDLKYSKKKKKLLWSLIVLVFQWFVK